MMTVWIDRILLLALVLVVAALTLTSLPWWSGQTLGGSVLMSHMMASGILVFGLPVFGLFFLRYFSGKPRAAGLQQAGYLATLATGLVTIITVFLCMLPIPPTEQMHLLMSIHGWAGIAMIPAVAVLLLGVRATRSASHHRS